MSDAPKSGIRVVGLCLAEHGEVPPLWARAGKTKCAACERKLDTGMPIAVTVYGRCVLCASCARGIRGETGEREMEAQAEDVDRMLRAALRPVIDCPVQPQKG